MRIIKNLVSVLAIIFVTTACAGNKKTNGQLATEEKNAEVIALNKADFLKKVYNYEANPKEWKFEGTRPAIIDFYATWCGPCKMMSPILDEISKEYSGQIDVYKIDVDKEQELATTFGVRSIPTLLIVPMKENPQIQQGAMSKEDLKKIINDFLLKDKSKE